MKINMTAAQAGVLLQFAAKNDIRHCLNGICLQVGGNKGFAIATDGVILGVFRLHLPDPLEETEVIIPRDILENAKCTATAPAISIIINQAVGDYGSTRAISVQQGAAEWRGTSSPGPFPNWRRVIPENVSGEPANLSVAVYEKLCKAAKLPKGTKEPAFILGQNGTGASIVRLQVDDFIGVVMPMRVDKEDIARVSVRPEWVC